MFLFGKNKNNNKNQQADDAKKKKRDSVVSVESITTPPDTPTTVVGSPTHFKEASLESFEELQSNLTMAIQENQTLKQTIADQNLLLQAQEIENREYREVKAVAGEVDLATLITDLQSENKTLAQLLEQVSSAKKLTQENAELQEKLGQLNGWYIATFGNDTHPDQARANYQAWQKLVPEWQQKLTSAAQQIITECHLEWDRDFDNPPTWSEVISLINQKITAKETEIREAATRAASFASQIDEAQKQVSVHQTNLDRFNHYLKSTLGISDLNHLPVLPEGETLASILASRIILQTTLSQKQARIKELETNTANFDDLNNQISTQQTTITDQKTQLDNLQIQGQKSRNWNIALGVFLVGSWLVMAMFTGWKFNSPKKKNTKQDLVAD